MEESNQSDAAHGAGYRASGYRATRDSSASCTSTTSWFGLDAAHYPAHKIVKIRDWKLGVLRLTLRLLVFLYITVYQIAYKASHLETANVKGVVGTQLHHPTWNDCDEFKDLDCVQNFVGLSRLPYCKQNNFTGTYQKYCKYWDGTQLMKPVDEGVLIPTRVVTYTQKRGCQPSIENNWECHGSMWTFVDADGEKQVGPKDAKPQEDVFIADVERYKVLFDHSAHSDAGTSAYSFEMEGTWLNCSNPDSKDDACKRSRLVQERGNCGGVDELSVSPAPYVETQLDTDLRAMIKMEQPPHHSNTENESLEGWKWPSSPIVLALCDGDVFSVGQLLTAASIGLDSTEPSRTNQTYRATGFGLVVRILYSNVEPWMGLKVFPWNPLGPKMHYSYHIKKHATSNNKLRMTKSTSNNKRTVQEFQGVTIITEQYGTLLIWDTTHLLVILTTTLALLAVANYIVDKAAVSLMTRSPEYTRLIYENPEPV